MRPRRTGPSRCLLGAGALITLAALSAPAAPAIGIADPPPLRWEEYREGEYLDRIKTIFRHQDMTPRHIGHEHFGRVANLVSDVDMFQVSEGETCEQSRCVYVVFSDGLGDIPFTTVCPFLRSGVEQHLRDGSIALGLEFQCEGSVLQVLIARDHYWLASVPTPGK
jgi:hypothetical protein